jgi:hypothetical protein
LLVNTQSIDLEKLVEARCQKAVKNMMQILG